MARVRKDPAERRQEFITVAKELFLAKGYEQTMVQDICKAAGVAKGTFFYYFPTKEDILQAIFEEWTQKFVADYARKAGGLAAVEKLRLFLGLMGREYDVEALVDELWDEHKKELVLQIWQRVLEQGFNPLLRAIIAQGNREGSMQVEHVTESMDFFWRLTDGMWPEEARNIDETQMEIREAMATRLMEQLLGMQKGSLAAPWAI